MPVLSDSISVAQQLCLMMGVGKGSPRWPSWWVTKGWPLRAQGRGSTGGLLGGGGFALAEGEGGLYPL